MTHEPEPQDKLEVRQTAKRGILELYNANNEPTVKSKEGDGQ